MNQYNICREYDNGRQTQTSDDDTLNSEAEYFGTFDGRRDFLQRLNLVDDKFLVKIDHVPTVQPSIETCEPSDSKVVITGYCQEILVLIMQHLSQHRCSCAVNVMRSPTKPKMTEQQPPEHLNKFPY